MSSILDVMQAINEFWKREDEFKQLDPKDLIKSLPSHLLPPYQYLPPVTLTEKQWIYRARPNNASYMQGKGKSLIKNYSYAPPKFTSLGRANQPNSPMFYGSEFISATAFESRWSMEEDALIGCWRVKTKSPNLRLAVCATRWRREISVKWQNKIPESLLLQLQFLDKIFSSDRNRKLWIETRNGQDIRQESPKDNIHKLSSVIAQHLVQREGVDGIMYHSAQAQGAKAVLPPLDESNSLFNVAINPQYVDKHMVLEKVYRVRIKSYDDDIGRRRASRSAIEIGIPINKRKLEFTKLSDKQNSEFDLIHNQSSVPMLLEGPSVLYIQNLFEIKKCREVVNSFKCGVHNSIAKLNHEIIDDKPTAVIETCCDDFCAEITEGLRKEGIWKDNNIEK